MNTGNWEDREESPNKTDVGHEDNRTNSSGLEELLVINWQLILGIEREYEEQRELARQFDEELDVFFALIRSAEPLPGDSSDPPGWPDL